MLPLVVLFGPLVGFLALAFFGRHLSFLGSALVSTGLVFLSLLVSAYLFYSVGIAGHVYLIDLAPWLRVGLLDVHFLFLVDPLTVAMFLVVTTVSSLVHLYSIEYMREDPHLPRFMSYLSLFTFFMLLLVSAGNLLLLFFGWEGVGICSYLLINFWFSRQEANRSALKAVVMNRIGDCGLILAMFIVFLVFRTLDLPVAFALASGLQGHSLSLFGAQVDLFTALGLALLLAVVGKSAQLGLHTWLPDAMEGPTPVSALIHAATMVTAGVYLLVRCSPFFENSPVALTVVALVGVLTMLFGSLCAVAQFDMKKLIAYSTASQLGYMVFACGLSQYHFAMFHLFNHAFFKALLFLAAGSVIHGLAGEQDMRRMGGLRAVMPVTYALVLVASLSLAAFPFTSGYFSKEGIIENALFADPAWGYCLYWLGLLGSFFTTYYSTKLMYLVFWRQPQHAYRVVQGGAHESPALMVGAMYPLVFLSLFSGFLFADLFVGPGTYFWSNAIHRGSILSVEHHFFADPGSLVALPLVFVALGFLSALWFQRKSTIHRYRKDYRFPPLVKPLSWTLSMVEVYRFLAKRFYFDDLFNWLAGGTFFAAPRGIGSVVEGHRLSAPALTSSTATLSRVWSSLHRGQVTLYVQFMVVLLSAFLLALSPLASGQDLALAYLVLSFLVALSMAPVTWVALAGGVSRPLVFLLRGIWWRHDPWQGPLALALAPAYRGLVLALRRSLPYGLRRRFHRLSRRLGLNRVPAAPARSAFLRTGRPFPFL
jgi:NADH-quinone oxidoreductase subunit L